MVFCTLHSTIQFVRRFLFGSYIAYPDSYTESHLFRTHRWHIRRVWSSHGSYFKKLKGLKYGISKLSSLHTIALTREAKLWEETRDCQGKKRVKCRVKHRPPPGEVGGAKLYRDFNELC